MQTIKKVEKDVIVEPTSDYSVPLCSNTELHKIERDILRHSGLAMFKEVDVCEVPIQFNGNIEYIHTSMCGHGNQDILVLVHGFGGSGVQYTNMLKELSQRFKVYCMDLLGLGLSSKPKFRPNGPQEAIDYFVESLESWTQSLGLQNFILGGHSLGGYISAQYALKYSEKVKKLYLFSPPGIVDHEDTRHYNERISELSFFKRQIYKMMYRMWEKKLTYSQIYKQYPKFFNFAVKMYVTKRLGLKGDEATLIHQFLKTVFQGEEGAETCLYHMFEPTTRAYQPLEKRLAEEVKVDTHVMFGDKDWMDSEGCKRIVKEKLRANFKLSFIKDCGHQLTLEQPNILVQILLSENKKE